MLDSLTESSANPPSIQLRGITMKPGISSASGLSSNVRSESETGIGIGSYNSISSACNGSNLTAMSSKISSGNGSGNNLMQIMSSKIQSGNGSGNNLMMMNQMMMMKKSSSSNMQSLMTAAARQKKIQKLCYDVRISIFCGILTLLFLRSCLSGGEMASPLDDLRQLQRSRHILFDSILISNTTASSSSDSSSSSQFASDSSSASQFSSDSSSSSQFSSDSSSSSQFSSNSSSSSPSQFSSDSSSSSSSASQFSSDSSSSSKFSSDSSSSSSSSLPSSSSSSSSLDTSSPSSSSSKFSIDSSSSSSSSLLSSSSSSSSSTSSSLDTSSPSSSSSSSSSSRHDHRSNLHHDAQAQNYRLASSNLRHRGGIDSPAAYSTSSIEPIIRIQLLLTPDSINPMSESSSCRTEQLNIKYHNLALRSMENTMDYCRLHRIEMHYSYVYNNHHHRSNNREIHKYNPRDDVLDRDAGPMIDNYNLVMTQKLAHIYRAVKQAMDSSLRSDYEEELGEEEDQDIQEGESGDQDSESVAEGTESGILAESRPKYNRSSDHIEAPAGPATSNWIWWIDADDNMLVFTNMSMELPIEARYGDDYNIVVFSNARDLSTDKNSESEAGADDAHNERVTSLLIRPCQWSLDVLDLLREQFMASASASSASSSLTMHRSDTMERFFLRSTPSPSWNISSKLYLESSSSSSLYGVVGSDDDPIAEKSDPTIAAKDQPLLTHFKSCHSRSVCLAQGHDRSNADQCPIHMVERAFEAARAQARSNIAVPKQAITMSQSRSHSSQII